MDFERVIGDIAAFLELRQLRFALVGGLAMHAYGLSRLTNDVDFLTDAAGHESVVLFMEEEGYETLHASHGYSNHLHPDEVMGRVDFIYVDDATLERIFTNAMKRVAIAGREIVVPSAEHVVAMKLLAMKNEPTRTLREMVDIQHLMSLPETNLDQVKEYFEKYGLRGRYDEIREISS